MVLILRNKLQSVVTNL